MQVTKIAGVQPAVGIYCATVDSEIAGHDGGGADEYLTDAVVVGVVDREFDRGQCPAHGVGEALKVGTGRQGKETAALGHTPHIRQSPSRELR